MVSKLASSAVDHGFEPRSGQAPSLNVSLEQIKVYHLCNNRIPNIKKNITRTHGLLRSSFIFDIRNAKVVILKFVPIS